MKFHVYYTENLRHIRQDHEQCCAALGVKTSYHEDRCYSSYDEVYSAHGEFMTSILRESPDEVVGFLDVDCLPHNLKTLQASWTWAEKNRSFVGNAQNISHTVMRNRIYAAASCLIISKSAWRQLGNPSLAWFLQDGVRQIDTAQLLSLRADEIGFRYSLMYPMGYDGDETYELGPYGKYGIGTLYPATWHYFRISNCIDDKPKLWETRVRDVLEGRQIIPANSSYFYAT